MILGVARDFDGADASMLCTVRTLSCCALVVSIAFGCIGVDPSVGPTLEAVSALDVYALENASITASTEALLEAMDEIDALRCELDIQRDELAAAHAAAVSVESIARRNREERTYLFDALDESAGRARRAEALLAEREELLRDIEGELLTLQKDYAVLEAALVESERQASEGRNPLIDPSSPEFNGLELRPELIVRIRRLRQLENRLLAQVTADRPGPRRFIEQQPGTDGILDDDELYTLYRDDPQGLFRELEGVLAERVGSLISGGSRWDAFDSLLFVVVMGILAFALWLAGEPVRWILRRRATRELESLRRRVRELDLTLKDALDREQSFTPSIAWIDDARETARSTAEHGAAPSLAAAGDSALPARSHPTPDSAPVPTQVADSVSPAPDDSIAAALARLDPREDVGSSSTQPSENASDATNGDSGNSVPHAGFPGPLSGLSRNRRPGPTIAHETNSRATADPSDSDVPNPKIENPRLDRLLASLDEISDPAVVLVDSVWPNLDASGSEPGIQAPNSIDRSVEVSSTRSETRVPGPPSSARGVEPTPERVLPAIFPSDGVGSRRDTPNENPGSAASGDSDTRTREPSSVRSIPKAETTEIKTLAGSAIDDVARVIRKASAPQDTTETRELGDTVLTPTLRPPPMGTDAAAPTDIETGETLVVDTASLHAIEKSFADTDSVERPTSSAHPPLAWEGVSTSSQPGSVATDCIASSSLPSSLLEGPNDTARVATGEAEALDAAVIGTTRAPRPPIDSNRPPTGNTQILDELDELIGEEFESVSR
jgi:hypothetical protein